MRTTTQFLILISPNPSSLRESLHEYIKVSGTTHDNRVFEHPISSLTDLTGAITNSVTRVLQIGRELQQASAIEIQTPTALLNLKSPRASLFIVLQTIPFSTAASQTANTVFAAAFAALSPPSTPIFRTMRIELLMEDASDATVVGVPASGKSGSMPGGCELAVSRYWTAPTALLADAVSARARIHGRLVRVELGGFGGGEVWVDSGILVEEYGVRKVELELCADGDVWREFSGRGYKSSHVVVFASEEAQLSAYFNSLVSKEVYLNRSNNNSYGNLPTHKLTQTDSGYVLHVLESFAPKIESTEQTLYGLKSSAVSLLDEVGWPSVDIRNLLAPFISVYSQPDTVSPEIVAKVSESFKMLAMVLADDNAVHLFPASTSASARKSLCMHLVDQIFAISAAALETHSSNVPLFQEIYKSAMLRLSSFLTASSRHVKIEPQLSEMFDDVAPMQRKRRLVKALDPSWSHSLHQSNNKNNSGGGTHLKRGPKRAVPDPRMVPSYLYAPAIASTAHDNSLNEANSIGETLWTHCMKRMRDGEVERERRSQEMEYVRLHGMNTASSGGMGGHYGNSGYGPPKSTRIYLAEPIAVSLFRDPNTNTLRMEPCNAPKTSIEPLIQAAISQILDCFTALLPSSPTPKSSSSSLSPPQNRNVHPDRLIYCLTGILFTHTSPNPFGGPRSNLGYWVYNGTTSLDLINFIVGAAYRAYMGMKGRQGLDAVVAGVNRVLELHNLVVVEATGESDSSGGSGVKKNLTDELVLRGMNRSNHAEFYRVSLIPEHLRLTGVFDDDAANSNIVYFTARDVRSRIDSE
ncbi:hypothetical protein HK100_006003 [Physocladia obscura]|uniref:Uncharacterized protein n=1 Tax=Physocladia obscura TaxID=109957 RepID=A0AAD5SWM8_9FUNG|nr:hypothetical protein HK100_006003 [Physocladia obscura]